MKYFLLLILLLSCRSTPPFPNRNIASEKSWGFLVLSDIHIYTQEKEGRKIIPKNFNLLVKKLQNYSEQNNIKFIILLGDSTSGNTNDNVPLTQVKHWWDELYRLFEPLIKKGVSVIPVAGNHDYYTKNHKKGYEYGWNNFIKDSSPELHLSSPGHLYYELSYGSLDLFLLHLVDYNMDKTQKEWLINETQSKKNNDQIKMALGHVALYTRLLKKPFKKFGDEIKSILQAGNVHHYIGGHEHYFWDEFIDQQKFRQTIMGTSSGTYNFTPHPDHYLKYCLDKFCDMVPGSLQFEVNPKDRKQFYSQMFLHIQVSEDAKNYQMIPMAFYEEKILPFGQFR